MQKEVAQELIMHALVLKKVFHFSLTLLEQCNGLIIWGTQINALFHTGKHETTVSSKIGPARYKTYIRALDFAFSRKQGKKMGVKSKEAVSIIEHPDVKRMILDMKSKIDAMRGLILTTGVYCDLGKHHSDEQKRNLYNELVDLLIPRSPK